MFDPSNIPINGRRSFGSVIPVWTTPVEPNVVQRPTQPFVCAAANGDYVEFETRSSRKLLADCQSGS